MNNGVAIETIECRSRGFFQSSTYDLTGATHLAEAKFGFFTSAGEILADGTHYTIRRRGFINRVWTLECGHEIYAEAERSAFSSIYDIESPMGQIRIERLAWFDRTYTALGTDGVICTVSPPRWFSSTSELDLFRETYDWPTICFLYWLVEDDRRAEMNSSGSMD